MSNNDLEKTNLAIIRIKENKIDEAKAILSQINNAKSYFNAAIFLEKVNQLDLALKFYDRSIEIDKNYFKAIINKGKLIEKKGDILSAIKCLNDALAIKTNLHYVTYHNLGNLHSKLLNYKTALKCFIKSYRLNNDNLHSLHNIGNILEEIGKFNFSLRTYNKLIDTAKRKNIINNFPKTLLNRSLLLVKFGNYKDGLKDYEQRWLTPEFINRKRNFGVKTWKKDQNILGKTLLVFNEQGLGDTIYFFGCLKEIVKKNIKVVFLIQKPLKNLCKNINRNIIVVSDEDELPKIDYSVSLLSLPYYLGIDEKKIKDLRFKLKPEKVLVSNWKSILSRNEKNIGISWKSSQQKESKNRTIDINQIIYLFNENKNINFYCLHHEYEHDEKLILNKFKNVKYYLGDKMNFENTSALCKNLDLVISNDTSVAHISCATGTKTWIISRKNPSWLCPINSNKSLMYPNAKYFKQDRFNDWKSVIEKVSLDLKNL